VSDERRERGPDYGSPKARAVHRRGRKGRQGLTADVRGWTRIEEPARGPQANR
jgi:hypothetical protein